MNRNMKKDSTKCDSKQLVNKLSKQLSNNSRELQLSQQIRSQLEKIRLISIKIKDILNRLLYEIADLSAEELEDLHQKEYEAKIELKELEMRYRMLKDIEKSECFLNIKPIAIESRNNELIVNNKRVLIEGIDDNRKRVNVVDYDYDSDTDIEDDSSDSVISYVRNGFDQRLSPRKRIIPERFESFPSIKRSKRFLNGMRF